MTGPQKDVSGVRVVQSLVFCVMFCRLLFVLLVWSLHCLYFDLRLLLITSLVSFKLFLDCNLNYLIQIKKLEFENKVLNSNAKQLHTSDPIQT